LRERTVERHDIRVDTCPRCKGIWFDKEELESLLRVGAKELRVPSGAERAGRLCPRCSEALLGFTYPQTYVQVEMCKTCGGLWLDAGELAEIKTVREHLRLEGKLDPYAPVQGLKGALLRFIDAALGSLT